LEVNKISAVVESEMGFHLLWCQKIYPANTMTLAQANPRIYQSLQDRYKVRKQRQWLARLPRLTRVKEYDYV